MKKYTNPTIELIELTSDEIMAASSLFGGDQAGDVGIKFSDLFGF